MCSLARMCVPGVYPIMLRAVLEGTAMSTGGLLCLVMNLFIFFPLEESTPSSCWMEVLGSTKGLLVYFWLA